LREWRNPSESGAIRPTHGYIGSFSVPYAEKITSFHRTFNGYTARYAEIKLVNHRIIRSFKPFQPLNRIAQFKSFNQKGSRQQAIGNRQHSRKAVVTRTYPAGGTKPFVGEGMIF